MISAENYSRQIQFILYTHTTVQQTSNFPHTVYDKHWFCIWSHISHQSH